MRMEELEITTELAAAPEENAAADGQASPEEQVAREHSAPEAAAVSAEQPVSEERAAHEQAGTHAQTAPVEQAVSEERAAHEQSGSHEETAPVEQTVSEEPTAHEQSGSHEETALVEQTVSEESAAHEQSETHERTAPVEHTVSEDQPASEDAAPAEQTAPEENVAAAEHAAPEATIAAESESAAVAEEAATEEAAADESAAEAEAIEIHLPPEEAAPAHVAISDEQLQAVLEAVVYIAEEPLTLAQMASALGETVDRIETVLRRLIEEFERAEHGIGIREVAGGFKMATKAEHHEAVRHLVKSLKPPLKLSLPALETLAVIAYKQPVTGPEIMQIRGVQGGGVLKTLLDRKLIAGAGRKNVVGKPMLYKTTKEFMIQFGLKDINELPSLKEFEEIRRMAFGETETAAEPVAAPETQPVAAATAAPAEASNEAAPAVEPSPGPVAEAAPAAALNEPAADAEAAPGASNETEHAKADAPASEAPPEPEPEA